MNFNRDVYWRNNGSIVNVNIVQTSESCIKLHAVAVLVLLLSFNR